MEESVSGAGSIQIITDPDLGRPKAYISYGSGSRTQLPTFSFTTSFMLTVPKKGKYGARGKKDIFQECV
jgi:hypothetical protein